MAKYKITSIPQARYGGVFNKSTKITKGRKNNDQDVPEESMVEVQNVEQPSYWNQMQSPVMQGKQCPPGKVKYNGECITELEYIKASAAEEAAFNAKIEANRQRHRDERAKAAKEYEEYQRKSYDDKVTDYFTSFDESKKSDKIKPFESVPTYNVNDAQLAELKKQFLVNKTENGYYDLYPLNVVYDRIINNGFQADQFKNYWGLDSKQVKEQLDPLMKAAKEQYDATVTNKIIDQAVREGKTVSEVVKSLPASIGNQKALKAYIKPAQEQINKAFDFVTKQYSEAGVQSSQDALSKTSKDQDIFLSNDPQAAWEKRYHANDMMYQANKMERGQKAFDNWMTNYASTPNEDIRYSQDDQMAMQRNANQRSIDNVNLSTASNKRKIAENEDFTKAQLEFLGNFSTPERNQVFVKALNELNDKDKAKYLGMLDTDPNAAMQSLLGTTMPNSKKTYKDLLSESVENSLYHAATNTLKQGTPGKELTTGDKVLDVLKHPFDATYFAMNPRETMWDNKSGTYRQRVKDQDKLGVNLGTMPDYSPMWAMNQAVNVFNPFKIGMNLREGYDEGDFTGALGKELWDVGTTYGGMKGLGAIGKGTGILKPIGSNVLSNPLVDASMLIGLDQNVENATDAFNKGDYKTAAWEAGMAGLSALPAYNFAKGLRKVPNLDYYNFNQTVQPTQNILDSKKLLGYKDGGNLPKANLGQIVKAGKNIGRMANIGTLGTVNTLAKTIAPIMWNPAMIATETGPFTGSPLNVLPFYGKDMKYTDNTAFRKFGDTLDYVKLTGELNPTAGPLLRLGKKQIANEGNWAELGKPNEQYTGVFGAQFNPKVPGSDLNWKSISGRNGVLITDANKNLKVGIPISDPGLSFHRRLPFSNRYIPIDMEALRNDQFDPRTMGGNLQSLLERYGYAALGAAGLGVMGNYAPQETLDEYINTPIKNLYKDTKELLTNPWSKDTKPLKKDGGVVMKLSKKEIDKYIKEGYIIEDE